MSKEISIAFVLFPDLTQLDFTGPLQVLSRLPGARVHLVAATMEPTPTDTALKIPPTVVFDECPPVDVLCAPGGFGVEQAIQDEKLMAFVRREGARAAYVSSVCTGAFILGAAGLLKGKKATTHWAYHDELTMVGAEPVKARVVRDGNIFTGGGVTAGIDFALTLAVEIAGPEVAKAIQLGLEYDPDPPLNAGSPDKAPGAIRAMITARYAPRVDEFKHTLSQTLARAS